MLPFWPEFGPPGVYTTIHIFPVLNWTTEASKYNIPRPSPHLSHPSKLRCTLLSLVAPKELCCPLLSY